MAHKTRKGAFVALLAAGSITLGALPSMSAPRTISAGTFQQTWTPGKARVPKGKKVVWKNPSLERHNVRSFGTNWTLKKRTIDPGESTSKTFKKPGVFRYRCTIHSFKQNGSWAGMVGKIRVTR